jgi:hypothetical protein
MNDALVVCADCYRHVRAAERACPFCRAARDAPPPASRPGALHTAVIAAALSLAVSERAHAQLNPLGSPRFDMVHGGAQGYGGPPSPTPMTGLPTPPVAPNPAPAVFELARQPLPAPGRRSRAPWSIALRVAADGAWTAPGRSGRLSPSQLAELRAAADRASLNPERTTPSAQIRPTRVERVTLGAHSVSWPEPGYGLPNRDLRHLIEMARRFTGTRS